MSKEKGSLLLVTSDPLDIESMDGIRLITGLQINPALALESEIRDAIRKYYDHEEFRPQTINGFAISFSESFSESERVKRTGHGRRFGYHHF